MLRGLAVLLLLLHQGVKGASRASCSSGCSSCRAGVSRGSCEGEESAGHGGGRETVHAGHPWWESWWSACAGGTGETREAGETTASGCLLLKIRKDKRISRCALGQVFFG